MFYIVIIISIFDFIAFQIGFFKVIKKFQKLDIIMFMALIFNFIINIIYIYFLYIFLYLGFIKGKLENMFIINIQICIIFPFIMI